MPILPDRGAPKLLFPLGALCFSAGVERLIEEGRLDPMPFVQRHQRGDWGEIPDYRWYENNAALLSDGRLDSFYEVTREIHLFIVTAADRSETRVLLASER